MKNCIFNLSLMFFLLSCQERNENFNSQPCNSKNDIPIWRLSLPDYEFKITAYSSSYFGNYNIKVYLENDKCDTQLIGNFSGYDYATVPFKFNNQNILFTVTRSVVTMDSINYERLKNKKDYIEDTVVVNLPRYIQ